MYILNRIVLTFFSVSIVSAEKIYKCTEPNTIALTFDDGPYEYTMDLLDRLQSKNIHATFFINGYNYWHDLDSDPDKQAILKRAHTDGHQIASHTWKHEIPENMDEVQPMMSKLDDLIEKCVGYRPKYFRPPKGECNDDCVKHFEELGYHVIEWDTDTNDWNLEMGVEERIAEVKSFLTKKWEEEKVNYLVLMHDVYDSTVNSIVPWILEHAPFDKYKFVTVAECLGDNKETHYDAHGNSISSKTEPEPEPEPKPETEETNPNIVTDPDAFNLNTNTSNSDNTNDAKKVTYHYTIGFMILIYILYSLI